MTNLAKLINQAIYLGNGGIAKTDNKVYVLKLTSEYKAEKLKIFIKKHQEMIELYKSGSTLNQVGIKFNVTSERVRQIMRKCNVHQLDGGIAINSLLNTSKKIAKKKDDETEKEQRCLKLWGCTSEQRKFFGKQSMNGTIANKFKNQRNNANTRGIAWELTIKEWWDIWQESGCWQERGIGSGKYVMARSCDVGSYSKDNVKIITHNDNSKEARLMDKIYSRGNFA